MPVLPHLRELFVAFFEQAIGIAPVKFHAIALPIRTEIAADVGTFVPIDAQPAQIFQELSFKTGLAAFNVSGEYALVKDAAHAGHLDERAAALEGLTAIRRAGADLVVSYWTKELAGWL